ncbi:MAG: Eco57I restriction-modification methylase domain-containing protein [Bradymonadia bacterium]
MTRSCTSMQSIIKTFHASLVADVDRWSIHPDRTQSVGISNIVRETLTREVIRCTQIHYVRRFASVHDELQPSNIDGLSSSWTSHWHSSALAEAANALWRLLDMESLTFIDQLQQTGRLYECLLALDDSQHTAAMTDRDKGETRRYRDGVHFTPTQLADALVQTTLAPLLETIELTNSPSAILALRICDPAMGCGALLIDAVERLARHLARIRLSSDGTTSLPLLDLASARRDIVEHCIYGVDKHEPTVKVARLILSVLSALPNCKPIALDARLKAADALYSDRDELFDDRSHTRSRGSTDLSDANDRYKNASSQHTLKPHDLPTAGEPAFKWSHEFPEVWQRGNAGFDVVLANPPFGTVIGSTIDAYSEAKVWWHACAPQIAVGAFDKASLFLHLSIQLLNEDGRYGLFLPRSILAGGRAATAIQAFVNAETTLTDFHLFEDPKLFDGANIFVTALSGTRQSHAAHINVHREGHSIRSDVNPMHYDNWWHLIVSMMSANDPPNRDVEMVSLSELFQVDAGCATGAAYSLAGELRHGVDAPGLKLITTGLIDRYTFLWDTKEVRYLKQKYTQPYWPAISKSSPVRRAAARQACPKLLVGGLTKTLEVAYDPAGEMGGVVSTWVIRDLSKNTDPLRLQLLELLLNSWVVSWNYHSRHGAQQSPWGGMTIKKAGINTLELPIALFDKGTTPLPPTRSEVTSLRHQNPPQTTVQQLRQLTRDLNIARNQGDWIEVDRLDEHAQPLIAELYGLDATAFSVIDHWYQKRAKRSPLRDIARLTCVTHEPSSVEGGSNDLAESLESAHKH